MIITFKTYTADGLGPFKPESGDGFEWAQGANVTFRGTHYHSDGSAYDLTGAYTMLMSFKQRDSDLSSLVARQATIVDPTNGVYEVYISSSDVALGLVAGDLVCGVEFVDSTGLVKNSDEALPATRCRIRRTIVVPNEPISVPTYQQPLAQGPKGDGFTWRGPWNSTAAYNPRDEVNYPDPNGGTSNAVSSFVCLIANTNVPPLDVNGALSADWNYVAMRGADGSSGNITWPGPPSGYKSRAVYRGSGGFAYWQQYDLQQASFSNSSSAVVTFSSFATRSYLIDLSSPSQPVGMWVDYSTLIDNGNGTFSITVRATTSFTGTCTVKFDEVIP